MAVAALVVSLLATACGSTEPAAFTASDSLPTEAPWGLDTIEMPAADRISPLFGEMPDQIDGVPQEMSTPDVVAYRDEGGRSLQLQVLSVADLRDFSDGEELTLVDFLSVLVDSGELEELESVQLDTTMPLSWVVSSVVGDGETVYTAVWGSPGAGSGFSVTADTPEARTALVHAFIGASHDAEGS